VPLVALRGQNADELARELEAQFAPWPGAGEQVGLLDQDGDGRLDAVADVPADGVFRLYRLRSDGTLSVEVFVAPGRGTWNDLTRRLEEAAVRRAGKALADLLAARPAGPVRTLAETTDFARARGQYQAGNFADAGKVDGAAARSVTFQNWRGEPVRALETLTAAPGGVTLRTVVVLPQPNSQEVWEETTTQVRPQSFWRTDVEVTVGRQTRTTAGAPVGSLGTSGPMKFSVER